ncbi:MAG: cobalamin-dependent protein, partial [bacterium]
LGVAVEPEAFVEAIEAPKPELVGMSCLLTTVFDDMKATIASITSAGLRDQVKILIGGGPVDQSLVEYVGADVYCRTAQAGVAAAKRILEVR